MHGFGTYRFADGATYEGIMRNSWPNGEGTSRYANGGVYVGRWKDGKHEVNGYAFRLRLTISRAGHRVCIHRFVR